MSAALRFARSPFEKTESRDIVATEIADDAITATLAFSSARPAELASAASSNNQLAEPWVCRERINDSRTFLLGKADVFGRSKIGGHLYDFMERIRHGYIYVIDV